MKAIEDFCRDKFKLVLTAVVLIAVIVALFSPAKETKNGDGIEIHFFFSPTCPHCAEQEEFNPVLVEKYGINIVHHDVTKPGESALFLQFAERYNIDRASLGVPATFFGGQIFIGFDSAETTGAEIDSALKSYLEGLDIKREEARSFRLPFVGEFDVSRYSLPALAVILGLVDGFNPCAMWALVFLIGLVIGLRDYRKLWLLVGSFVLSSGILYFLFMTAWLNVFLFVGYMKPIIVFIGAAAVWFGVANMRDFFTKPLVCEMPSEGKRKIAARMEQLVTSPMTWASIFGVIALAFVINSLEFVCSSFIPAVFTQTLALAELSPLQHYGFILLYDFFFMLDDLIIFSLAAFAVTHIGDKYAKWCKFIGGIILFALGIVLLFFPHLLR